MSDILGSLRELAQVSAIAGVSGGAVAACAALAWFLAPLRPLAIAAAVAAAGTGAGALYGFHLEKQSWAASDARAAAKADKRDTSNETDLAKEFPPTSPAEQQKADSDAQRVLADISAAAAGNCVLGPGPLRLRQK